MSGKRRVGEKDDSEKHTVESQFFTCIRLYVVGGDIIGGKVSRTFEEDLRT